MEIVSPTKDELQKAINDILAQDIAKQKRQELSYQSFQEWLYSIVRVVFAKLGYELQSFEEFWRDIGINISQGWKDGREHARNEAEIKRKIRERRYQ